MSSACSGSAFLNEPSLRRVLVLRSWSLRMDKQVGSQKTEVRSSRPAGETRTPDRDGEGSEGRVVRVVGGRVLLVSG
jgi:hypothetical protein